MAESSMPLFPTDDGWPYADDPREWATDDGIDLDVLQLLCDPHVYDTLTAREQRALFMHFGLGSEDALTMKQLGPALGCTHAEAAELIGTAVDKLRSKLHA